MELAQNIKNEKELAAAWDCLLLSSAAVNAGISSAAILPQLLELQIELEKMAIEFPIRFAHLQPGEALVAGVALAAMIESCGKLMLQLTPTLGVQA